MAKSKNDEAKQSKGIAGQGAFLQQPSLARPCSSFQVPVGGGSRHAEARGPGGKREHPATAGPGLSPTC